MRISNELLDHLGDAYKAVYPGEPQPTDMPFINYVENYVESTSKNVEKSRFILGVKRTIDKK